MSIFLILVFDILFTCNFYCSLLCRHYLHTVSLHYIAAIVNKCGFDASVRVFRLQLLDKLRCLFTAKDKTCSRYGITESGVSFVCYYCHSFQVCLCRISCFRIEEDLWSCCPQWMPGASLRQYPPSARETSDPPVSGNKYRQVTSQVHAQLNSPQSKYPIHRYP